MTADGNAGGNAGSNGNENNGGSGGAPGGQWPSCSQCQGRHRPGVPCWQPCPRCGIRHHRRSVCPTADAHQQQISVLQQQNAQMVAEMQQLRVEVQARSAHAAAYGYGGPPLPPHPPQPFFPSYPSYPSSPWQPQQVMPPMGMGRFPYQGAQYPPSMPPPGPYVGGSAVGVPQGMPSDAFNWFGGGSEQASRRGGLPWNNRGRGGRRPGGKANEKDKKKKKENEKEKEKEREKEKEKEKERDPLAPEPSGVQKPGKSAVRNARRRQKLRARKEKKDNVDDGREREEEGEMSGVENSTSGTQPSGPSQNQESEQQIAVVGTASANEAQLSGSSQGLEVGQHIAVVDTVLATEDQAQVALLVADNANAAEPLPSVLPHQTADESGPPRSLLDMAFEGFFAPGDNYDCTLDETE